MSVPAFDVVLSKRNELLLSKLHGESAEQQRGKEMPAKCWEGVVLGGAKIEASSRKMYDGRAFLWLRLRIPDRHV